MSKFHIKKDGTPGICKANLGICPLGQHYENIEEAERDLETINNGKEYWHFIQDKSSEEMLKQLGIKVEKGTMTEFEVLKDLAVSYATVDKDKEPIVRAYTPKSLKIDSKTKEEIYSAIDVAFGDKIKDPRDSINLILENETAYYIWSRNNGTLDLARIDKGGIDGSGQIKIVPHRLSNQIRTIEVKDLTSGAQSSRSQLNKVDDTEYSLELSQSILSQDYSDKIKENIKSWSAVNNSYQNKTLELTNNESIDFIVRDYVDKGATDLVIKSGEGKIHRINLVPINIDRKLTEEDIAKHKETHLKRTVNRLEKLGIKATVYVRANMFSSQTRKIYDEEVESFKRSYGSTFKDGKPKEVFTLRDLNVNHLDKANTSHTDKYVTRKRQEEAGEMGHAIIRSRGSGANKKYSLRIGNMEYRSNERISPDQEINIRDFKVCDPFVSGSLRKENEKDDFGRSIDPFDNFANDIIL